MASSNYDVNVQLALATTAEYEGDLDSALDFLAEAHRLAREDREAHAQVYGFTTGLQARQRAGRSLNVSLSALAAVV